VTDKVNGIRLIAGLGNPGSGYADTRHNAGLSFIETLCQHFRIALTPQTKFSARVGEWSFGGKTYSLLIPTTYMNHSGQAIGAFAKYTKIPPEHILIAHDELDLEPGDFRFKLGGGHAGHNGLRDIIHHLNSRDFHRIRLGIGHPGDKDEVSDYVLSKPNREDKLKIKTAIQEALTTLQKMLVEHQL
jgi:PTH1 family peptidyl-tRNA hydrolase